MSAELFESGSNFKCSNLSMEINEMLVEANNTALPEVLFQQNFAAIVVYSALFLVAAVANLTVFFSLYRSRHRKSRISLMIRHLAIADLIVTFIMIPIEVGWRVTGKWIAGNAACKIILFLRAFGPYLSSNVLVCVSLDRYFAVLHPLKVNDARRRGKVMLAFAWSASFIYCIPQSFVFRVQSHPSYPNYQQCVSFGFFSSRAQEIAYNLMCVMCMYFIPLFVIIIAYTAIMCEISKNSKDTKGETYRSSNGRMRLRRSDISNIERARSRTLRMTITIVAVYVWCCTPYVIITLWYMFDRAGAISLPSWLQDMFFMMVVSNSCMNPIVYGSYVIDFKRFHYKCFFCYKKPTINEPNTHNEEQTQAVAGRSTNIARDVIKCVLRLQKVGSAATRSTTMMHGTNLFKKKNKSNQSGLAETRFAEIPPSAGHVSFLNESICSHHLRPSFHSEPCPQTSFILEKDYHNVSSYSADL